jgi:hypothetical protein
MDILLGLLKSRKFWAAVVGLAAILLQAFVPHFPFNQEQITNFVYVVVAFILGTGLEDVGPYGQAGADKMVSDAKKALKK